MPVVVSPWTIATYHPSALLRIPDEAMKRQAEAEFLADLRQVAKELERLTPSPRYSGERAGERG